MEERQYIVHPYKFAMWIFLLTLIMIFGGLTSAYIVSRSFVAVEKLIMYQMPSILIWNNIALIISSFTMYYSLACAKKEEYTKSLYAQIATLVLGVLFLYGQFLAWKQLTAGGLTFVDRTRIDNSVSFFYMFTGLHGLHIIAAVIAVGIGIYLTASRGFKSGRMILTLEVVGTFWHFLGLLWLYLYVFLLYNQQ